MVLGLGLLAGCGGPVRTAGAEVPAYEVAAVLEAEEPAPPAVPEPPVADGFELPVGAPDAAGYYDAQPFGGDSHHLGSDWNGVGGGNTDYGDPVTAAAAGIVVFAEDAGPGWGKVVIVRHRVRDDRGDTTSAVETLYGHLATVDVAVGDTLARRDAIGTIGDAEGRYTAHLHFEVRTAPDLGVGGGYALPEAAIGWTDPSAFVRAHPVR